MTDIAKTSESPVHKAQPWPDKSNCVTCGQRVHRVPGGNGPVWVHSDSGAVAAPNPAPPPPPPKYWLDAIDVYNETGLTPRQLAQQASHCAELLAALAAVVDSYEAADDAIATKRVMDHARAAIANATKENTP